MEKENKAIVKEKKFEFLLGIFFLIPPILGVIAFVLQLFDADTDFSELRNLSYHWTCDYGYSSNAGGGGGMSAAPIYLGMMAMVGAYLVKNNLRYFLSKEDKPQQTVTPTQEPEA